MQYKEFQNISLSRLGMGCMRLPLIDPGHPNSEINYPEAHKILDLAMEQGITYYDSAYVYNHGDSEKCTGIGMHKYPRESYYLATKFNLRANPDYKAVFEEQLERLQTDYIDFYLLHCVQDDNYQNYLDSGAIAYFEEQKQKGRIRYFGFSSHASPEVLAKFAAVRAWDFAQIQLNYYDWLFGTAKAEYEILTGRNIPVMVMEPVRGGRLAALTPETEARLKEAHPDWSIASWALRFVQSLPGVQVILSGMSSLEQVRDNIATFSADNALCEADRELLFSVCEQFKKQLTVPCTGCGYCSACPMDINIPEYLKLYNIYKADGEYELYREKDIISAGKPADCIGCGACTCSCPQNIDTPTIMKELAKLLKNNL